MRHVGSVLITAPHANRIALEKSKSGHRPKAMATANSGDYGNYDRTSANSFSKNCFGLAPITVLFTSPPWKR
jgi:hypothetical protein